MRHTDMLSCFRLHESLAEASEAIIPTSSPQIKNVLSGWLAFHNPDAFLNRDGKVSVGFLGYSPFF